jgi:hypothetical protein
MTPFLVTIIALHMLAALGQLTYISRADCEGMIAREPTHVSMYWFGLCLDTAFMVWAFSLLVRR